MRLDKRVAKSLGLTRREARRVIKSGQVWVNGIVSRELGLITQNSDTVKIGDKSLNIPVKRYIMLHKPKGYLSTKPQDGHPSALELLDPVIAKGLHFVGRLDLDTTGMLLLTDDGNWSHSISSPRKKQIKVYRVTLAEALTDSQISALEAGVLLNTSRKPTEPTKIQPLAEKVCKVPLTEGRYHQVKRMFASVGNHVESLHRESIGHLTLDAGLKEGQWRHLTPDEVAGFV